MDLRLEAFFRRGVRVSVGKKRKKKPIVVHGKDLTAYGVFRLGQTYRMHADALASVVSQFGPQMSDHPRRLLYFQALENYLRSFQLLGGETPELSGTTLTILPRD
jgi:hypothetical protein